MKTRFCPVWCLAALLLGVSLFVAPLFAQQSGENTAAPVANESKGGFVGRNHAYSGIQGVRFLPSGSVIRVSGNIVGRIKENMYLLKEPDRNSAPDNNRIEGDRIAVEISDDLWQGQVVEVSDWVQIIGEVRRSDGIATLKAKEVTKDLNAARLRGQQPSVEWLEARRKRLNEQTERSRQGIIEQQQERQDEQ